MKKIIISFLLVLFISVADAQNYFGQTKSFIIAQNQNTEIVLNDKLMLILNDNGIYQVFGFNPDNDYLCSYWGLEMPLNNDKESVIADLTKNATFYTEGDLLFAGVALKGEKMPERVHGKIYTQGDKAIIIYDSDMNGHLTSNKIFFVIRHK